LLYQYSRSNDCDTAGCFPDKFRWSLNRSSWEWTITSIIFIDATVQPFQNMRNDSKVKKSLVLTIALCKLYTQLL